MGNDPKSDVINRQYERWTYPEPITDIPEWLKNNWRWYDPSHASPILWPDRPPVRLDILIAGCGTNQAAVFAYTNPDAKVVGVDISQASLDHQRFLQDKYGLDNLELHLLPIEELPTLGRQFDLVCPPVLMVMADPSAGMKALPSAFVRTVPSRSWCTPSTAGPGVTLLQSVFRDLGLGQDEESVAMVRLATSLLGPDHPVRSYFKIAPDLTYDAGLVDTFLIRTRTDLQRGRLSGADRGRGLVFQTWLMNSPYHAHQFFDAPNDFYSAINALPDATVVGDGSLPEPNQLPLRSMPAGSAERELPHRLRERRGTDYVPVFRKNCGFEGNAISRPGWRMPLSADPGRTDAADGRLAQYPGIADRAVGRGGMLTHDHARRFFEALWRLDFIAATFSDSR